MAVNTATQKSEGNVSHPSRLQLIYASHQQLEDELDTLRAYVSAAKKHHPTADSEEGGFSPWTGVQDAAMKCIGKAVHCLRLFNPGRKVTHFKGMTTLTKLYGSEATPQNRVVAFLASVQESFGDELPLEIVLSGGRCLQRLDPAAADNYLVERINDLLAPPQLTCSADDKEGMAFIGRYRDCLLLSRSSPAYRVHLRALLLLQIEAAAQAEQETHKLTVFDAERLEDALSSATCEELTKYEKVCWREAARLRELKAAPALPASSGVAAGEKNASSSPSPTAGTTMTHTSQSPGAVESRRGAAAVTSHFAGLSDWRWHAIRISILILLAVLVRFASGPLARALKSALQVTHTAQTRRRTLTL
ncbi:hypothetical protein ABB37_06297 [Leptomonas pyrrhocoris]|uniref:Uncharacterized protein n=1 Tax=Leptomonas pyrrhocoris TaxID=157538 RepID=A0A0N0VEJ1_LEPPY|nr:hypothetical protein ABB37_06297 [Leptomonas pyrrhocoris]XP_015656548.1 hypothetical protein ABB37_06297 [Leptomonas pyrrhocoris]KPA78108.1 hypothetical protein ABB37_06297 [Leptomonas pyrrhocoris]KPA78109.1 hypothetical protein ABB37_06297 [Leptomonas pyrrhocoris]|eukprot:XP_015656547.1 hypothetical protein ABB37_06297 [Leptomonas pyrrhocoris]